MSFGYNDEGLRVSKTVNGVTTNYYYQGTLLIAEETNSNIIVYLYDENGTPVGFMYRAVSYAEDVWDTYAFEKNIFGDVVAVYNADTGVKLISYTYGAWGDTVTSYHNGGSSTTATKNPYKYRGYYYDSDLAMYYLQTRYYDPAICRFINADIPEIIGVTFYSLTDKNLFAYCDNNPVMRVDPDGKFWNYVIGGVAGATAGGVSVAINSYAITGEVNWSCVIIGATTGAVGGIIGASGLGWGVQAVSSMALSSINDIGISKAQGVDVNWKDVLVNAVISGGISSVASSLTYRSREAASNIIAKGVARVTRGIDKMNSGSRYWKGSVKRGIEFMKNGVKSLNIAQGQASVIGTSISLVVTNVKTFLSSLWS